MGCQLLLLPCPCCYIKVCIYRCSVVDTEMCVVPLVRALVAQLTNNVSVVRTYASV